MQYFSFFVIIPVLCSIGSKNRMFNRKNQLTTRLQYSIYLFTLNLIICYIVKRK